jgi:hypothetical protein
MQREGEVALARAHIDNVVERAFRDFFDQTAEDFHVFVDLAVFILRAFSGRCLCRR